MDESGRSRSIRHPRIHRPDAGGRLPVYVHVPGPLENHAGCDEGVAVNGLSLAAVVPALALLVQAPGNAQAPATGSTTAVAADSITGKVIYSGPKPTVRTISMEANAACAKLHPTDCRLRKSSSIRTTRSRMRWYTSSPALAWRGSSSRRPLRQ